MTQLAPPATSRRTWLRRAALGALAPAWLVALPGCAGLGGPMVITLGEPELNALLARQFPLQRRLLEVLEVEAREPQLRLLPERNRLALALRLNLRDRLGGHRQGGELRFDSALRLDADGTSVRLTQVAVQSLRLDAAAGNGTDGTASPPLPLGLARALAERMLEDFVVWRLGAERQAQLKAAGLAPGAVTVTARGVEVTLARAGT